MSLLISIAGSAVLWGLYDRQREARDNERIVRVYSAQLDQAIADLFPIGSQLIGREPELLQSITRSGIGGAIERSNALRRVDPAAAEELTALFTEALETMNGTQLDQVRLTAVAARAQRLVNDLADRQQARADDAALQGLIGSISALISAVLLVGSLLTRERRSWVASAEQHAAEIRLLAEQDGLTGLPNRRRFDDDLDALALEDPSGRSGADAIEFALCDLNGFKEINDRLGHHAGDAVLVSAAHALAAAGGDAGTVYRIGGDEFCVISRAGRAVGDACARAFERPGEAPIGSVGTASWPLDHTVVEHAVRIADDRMYAAKRALAASAASAAQPRGRAA